MNIARRITLCADDFALDADSTSAILELAGAGRISAVSCFTGTTHWPEDGRKLLRFRDRLLLGLHFNLTEPVTGTELPLRRTIAAALARRIDRERIRNRLNRQIDAFVAVTGTLPDYIDGHQHVHTFPVIADIIRRVAAERDPLHPIPLRSVGPFFGPTDAPLKRAIIHSLAALGGHSTPGVPHATLNSVFAGDYSLRPGADFARLCEAWLELAPERALIMCHPRAGGHELEFLASPEFASLLDWHRIGFIRRADLARDPDSAGVLHHEPVPHPLLVNASPRG